MKKRYRRRKIYKSTNFKKIFFITIIILLIVILLTGILIIKYSKNNNGEICVTAEDNIIMKQEQDNIEEVIEKLIVESEEKGSGVEEKKVEIKETSYQKPIQTPVSLDLYKVTAYCPCMKCCGKTNGITASGSKAKAGRTIAASSKFAFGTKISINGHIYTVEDRGGAIKGNRIDIYFDNHADAMQFGVKYVHIDVLG